MHHAQFSQLIASLAPNDVIITVNERLARYAQQHLIAYHQARHTAALVMPTIVSLSTWTRTAIEQSGQLRVLSSLQTQQLWQQTSKQPWAQIQPCLAAWQIVQDHRLSLEVLAAMHYPNTEMWCQWAERFLHHCQRNHWICPYRGINWLSEHPPKLPGHIHLLGFMQLLPAQQQLWAQYPQQITVHQHEIPAHHQFSHAGVATEREEWIAAAHWAKHCRDTDPTASIACVIPNLSTSRDAILPLFTAICDSVNLSASEALFANPLIQSAWAGVTADWGSIIRSPFYSSHPEDICRNALLEQRVLERFATLSDYTLLSTLSNEAKLAHSQLWLKRITSYKQLERQRPSSMTMSQWCAYWQSTITQLGWPGSTTLDSASFQAHSQWHQLITQLAQSPIMTQPLSEEQAQACLQHALLSTLHQGAGDPNAIQVLGSLEAAGIPFTALWVCGMDHNQWPPPAQPNPYLPYALQARMHLPQATAHKQSQFCQELLIQYLSMCPSVHFSYALADESGPLQACQLIHSLPQANEMVPDHHLPSPTHPDAHHFIEDCSDEFGTAWTSTEAVRGGTACLKAQSACALQAYITYRLNVRPLNHQQFGLPGYKHGQLVHQLCETLWQMWQKQSSLQQQSAASRLDTLQTLTKQLIEQDPMNETHALFLAAEAQRLPQRLNQWLTIECQRPPFTILALEQQQTIQLGPLRFNTRVDRIDQVGEQQSLIIDYKTALSSCQDWFGERPHEPQLPLYLLNLAQPEQAGIAFAQIHAQKQQLIGHVANSQHAYHQGNIQLRTLDDWPQQLQRWRTQLETLAKQFQQGYAAINPRADACQYCHYRAICRLRST